MIAETTLKFLAELVDNNHREWFDENRDRYQSAKTDVKDLVDKVIERIVEFDEGVQGTTAKQSMFRIFRDVRFSKNKAPYKTNMGAWIAPGGRKSPFAGYYIHIEPGGKSFAAGGVYRPASNVLKAIREGIDYDGESLRKVLGHKDFEKMFGELGGDKVKTSPKGYSKDHPDIDLLRHKDFVVSHNLDDKELTKETFIDSLVEVYSTLYPLNQYLNRTIREIDS